MSWEGELNGDPLPWLLEPDTPGVRYLALRDLLDYPPDDPELAAAREAAHTQGPIAAILREMDAEGFWVKPGAGYSPKYRGTVWSIILLAQLGGSAAHDERIRRACGYLFDHALTSAGRFTATGSPSGNIDCLQGNLCAALVDMGYDDPRLETAFEWIARSVTGEGVAPADDQQADVRFYKSGNSGAGFACAANNGLACAWGGVKVMLALGKWPVERRTPLIERAIAQSVDFLFSTDPADADYPSGYSERPSGNWWKFGFPVFYITDMLQNVEALVKLGYGDDPRLSRALAVVVEKQDDQGRWPLEYHYTGKTWSDFGERRQPNKWVTLRALRALKRIHPELSGSPE
jgi:hypothetical protein